MTTSEVSLVSALEELSLLLEKENAMSAEDLFPELDFYGFPRLFPELPEFPELSQLPPLSPCTPVPLVTADPFSPPPPEPLITPPRLPKKPKCARVLFSPSPPNKRKAFKPIRRAPQVSVYFRRQVGAPGVSLRLPYSWFISLKGDEKSGYYIDLDGEEVFNNLYKFGKFKIPPIVIDLEEAGEPKETPEKKIKNKKEEV